MTNPLNKVGVYRGIIFHFRADNDFFNITREVCVRRLYPWEYAELISEILKERNVSVFRIPALETLAEANFILEVDSSILRGGDDWAWLRDLRRIVDVIAVASKGHIWSPVFMIHMGQGSIKWVEGVKGSDFSGLIGVVSREQTSVFINRVKNGLTIRNNTIFESVCRSLRQEEESYGFEFRLVRLFHSLEKLLGSQDIECGMKLAWLIGADSTQRKNIFEEFKRMRNLRNEIIHRVLLYDLMTSKQQSDTLNYIDKLHDWLFDALVDFLDSNLPLKDWQKYLKNKLFGE